MSLVSLAFIFSLMTFHIKISPRSIFYQICLLIFYSCQFYLSLFNLVGFLRLWFKWTDKPLPFSIYLFLLHFHTIYLINLFFNSKQLVKGLFLDWKTPLAIAILILLSFLYFTPSVTVLFIYLMCLTCSSSCLKSNYFKSNFLKSWSQFSWILVNFISLSRSESFSIHIFFLFVTTN